MQFTEEQRHTLIALACAVAWSDGVVEEEERAFVHELVARFAGESLPPSELERWLRDGPPQARISALPKELGEMFFYDAMRLA